VFSNKPCHNLRSNIIFYEIYDPFSVHAKRRAKVKAIKIKFMIRFFSFLCLNNLSVFAAQYQFCFCSSFMLFKLFIQEKFYLIALNYHRQFSFSVSKTSPGISIFTLPSALSKQTQENNIKLLVSSLTFIDFLSFER
jgi:hypothetical protein